MTRRRRPGRLHAKCAYCRIFPWKTGPSSTFSLASARPCRRVEVRAYALAGARDLGWEAADIRAQLLELSEGDFLRTECSTAPAGGLIWVFTPDLWDGGYLWIRLIERKNIIVVSFHEG